MGELLHYKEYTGWFDYSEEDGIFFGVVTSIRDVITFQSDTYESINQAFIDSVEDYLDFCKQRGEEPEKIQNYIGSNFDDFLKKEGILNETESVAKERVARNIGLEILEGVRYIKSLKKGENKKNEIHPYL
jgi:predicted RNase H-like HicB family nuclease